MGIDQEVSGNLQFYRYLFLSLPRLVLFKMHYMRVQSMLLASAQGCV